MQNGERAPQTSARRTQNPPAPAAHGRLDRLILVLGAQRDSLVLYRRRGAAGVHACLWTREYGRGRYYEPDDPQRVRLRRWGRGRRGGRTQEEGW